MTDDMGTLRISIADHPVLERAVHAIAEATHPECIVLFGSRTRGDAGPHSDYDLLVVVGADAKGSLDAAYAALRDTRNYCVDVITRTIDEFDNRKTDVGTIDYTIAREGQLVYLANGAEVPASRRSPRIAERQPGVPRSVDEWLERAAHDVRAFEDSLTLESPVWDTISFHAHQAAEKVLKAAVTAMHTEPPRTHRLSELLALAPPEVANDPRLQLACEVLWALYPRSRYPDTTMPTRKEAHEAGALARQLREAVGPAIDRRR